MGVENPYSLLPITYTTYGDIMGHTHFQLPKWYPIHCSNLFSESSKTINWVQNSTIMLFMFSVSLYPTLATSVLHAYVHNQIKPKGKKKIDNGMFVLLFLKTIYNNNF